MLNQAHMAEIADLLKTNKTLRGEGGHNHGRRPITINPTEDGTEIGKRSADAFRIALGLKPTHNA